MLEDHYYVPLYRWHDNTSLPFVGRPWVPTKPLKNDKAIFPSLTVQDHMISAIAGPMTMEEAQCLHDKWASPKRKDYKG